MADLNTQLAQYLTIAQNPQLVKLMQSLQAGGDPRYGGTLPIGGKAFANPHGNGPRPQNDPPMLLTTPMNGSAEAAGHDSYMNYLEARLQDELQAKGLPMSLGQAPGTIPRRK